MGKCATPVSVSSPSSSAIRTHQKRLPRTKSRVPSIGSTIQRRPLDPDLHAPSSPRMPSSGKPRSIASRISRSLSRSAMVTGDSSALASAVMPPARRWRAFSPAATAAYRARSSSFSKIMYHHHAPESGMIKVFQMTPLFDQEPPLPAREPLEEGAVLLRGFASEAAPALVAAIGEVAEAAPFRHLVTPGGYTMSV